MGLIKWRFEMFNFINVYKENKKLKQQLVGATNRINVLEAAIQKHVTIVQPIVSKRVAREG